MTAADKIKEIAMPINNTNYVLLLIFVILTALFLFILKLIFISDFFFRELKYLKSEIHRTRGKERERWKRRKRRLLLSLLPFVKYKKK